MDKLKDSRFAKFYGKFLTAIAGNYDFFEKKRKEYINQYLKPHWSVSFIILIAASLIACPPIVIFIIPTFVVIYYTNLQIKYSNKYKKFLKQELFESILNEFNDVNWSNSEYCNSDMFDEMKESGLFLNLKYKYLLDDRLRGTYKGVGFQAADIGFINPSYEYTESSKAREYDNDFNGIVLSYKFNKKIKTKTIVSTKKLILQKDTNKIIYTTAIIVAIVALVVPVFIYVTDHNVITLSNLLKDLLSFDTIGYVIVISTLLYYILSRINSSNINKIKKQNDFSEAVILEDSKFNKKFNVYSSDQVEVRYLVTPLFMEKFYNLKTVFGAKNIRCSFFDDNLMIAIETKRDLFEIGELFKPVRDIKTIERFYNEISAIFDMIDYFKLNENIYLK